MFFYLKKLRDDRAYRGDAATNVAEADGGTRSQRVGGGREDVHRIGAGVDA